MAREDTADYRELFLRDTPLLDTRAPVEFSRGAFPTAVNLPLMSDEERRKVGIRYKQSGQAAAIELGQSLVQGDVRRQRIEAWSRFALSNPDGYLYCFRGGLRSKTVQQWLRDAGIDYPLVIGGYKSMRRYLLDSLEQRIADLRFLLVAGKTGTGKTRVIESVNNAVDLEGLARHRGSSFGRLLEEQPSQIDFENALSIALLRQEARGSTTVLMEDEGKLIGRLSLPLALRARMEDSPLLVVEEPLESRVQVIYEDYIVDLGARYRRRYGGDGRQQHQQHLENGLRRIRRRLGDELYRRIDATLADAFQHDDQQLHRNWIETLLVDYYDPMYDYQMTHRQGAVKARGRRADIIAWALDGQHTG